jgi:hypothetical protein
MTRKKPLRRLKASDVRWSRWDNTRVVAAPIWAYEKWWTNYSRNSAAWASIYALRKRRIKDRERRSAEAKEVDIKALTDPNADEFDKTRASIRMAARRHMPREKRHGPPWAPYGTWRELRRCVVCKAKFYGQGRIVACTDACAKIQRDKTRTRGNPKPRRVTHEPRKCDECLNEFVPRRKDAKYCSTKCRVTSFRLREHPV